MSKDLATKQAGAVSTDLAEWGNDVHVGKDLLISKVLTMQAMSELVVESDAKMGEFRDSITKELLGDITKPVAFVPFHCIKKWDISESENGTDFKWVKSVPVVEDPTHPDYNDNWEWTVQEANKTIKRVRRLDFFCLIASQIGNGGLPVTISFRSTSYKAGQILFNQMYVRNKMVKKSPAGIVMNLGGIKDKNEKGTFVVTQAVPLRDATSAEQNEALTWYKLIKTSTVVVDESDNTKGTSPTPNVEEASAGRF